MTIPLTTDGDGHAPINVTIAFTLGVGSYLVLATGHTVLAVLAAFAALGAAAHVLATLS
jgi:hypothetical protein